MKTALVVLVLVGEASLFAWLVFAVDPAHWQVWTPLGLVLIWLTKDALKYTLWRKHDNDPGPVA